MRFWPFRRRRVALPSADSTAFTVAELAPQLPAVLAVAQAPAEGHPPPSARPPPPPPPPPAPPPLLIGTLGRMTRMRSPARDRNPLFGLAAAGPLAGLVVALPALWIGLRWSKVGAVPAGESVAFGDSLLLRFMTWLSFGTL